MQWNRWCRNYFTDQCQVFQTERLIFQLNHVVAVGLMSQHLILSWHKRLSVTAATWWNNASHVRTHRHTHLLLSRCNETCEYKRSTAPCVCVCVCNAAIPVIYIVATKGMLTMRPRYMRMAQFLQVLRAHQSPCFSSGTNLWALKYFKR